MNSFVKTFIIVLIFIMVLGGGIALLLLPSSSTIKNSPMSEIKELVGQSAPKFTLKDSRGNEYTDENLRGKNIILFFSEGIQCYPACWDQIGEFGADERLNNDETVSLSVVTDKPELWEGAEKKMPKIAQAKIVFDENIEVSRKFKMLDQPSSMHPGTIPGHSYIIIDKRGVIRFAYDDPKMGLRDDDLASSLSSLK